MSGGESDEHSDIDSGGEQSETESGYGSVCLDFSDWWHGAFDAHVETDEDDISTVCFGSNGDSTYAYDPNNNTDDLTTIGYGESENDAMEDGSSHGTVEEFCERYECPVCHVRPPPNVAVVINDDWMLEGHCRMHINGTLYIMCATCLHTYLGDCVDIDDGSFVGDITEYTCHECQDL